MLVHRKRLLFVAALLVAAFLTLTLLLRRSPSVGLVVGSTPAELPPLHEDEPLAELSAKSPPSLATEPASPVLARQRAADPLARPPEPPPDATALSRTQPTDKIASTPVASDGEEVRARTDRWVRSVLSKGECTIGISRLVVDGVAVSLPPTKVSLEGSQQLVFDDPRSRRVVAEQRQRVFRGEAQRTVKVGGTSSTRDGTPLPLQATSTTHALPVRYLSIPLLPYSCGYGDRAQVRDDLTDEDLIRFKITRVESGYRVTEAMNGFGDIDCLADTIAASRTGSGAVLRSRALLYLLSPLGKISAEMDMSLSVEGRMFASTCPGMSTGFFFWHFPDSEVDLTLAPVISHPSKAEFEGTVDLQLEPPEVHFVQNYLHGLGLMREWAPVEYRASIRVETAPNAESRLHAVVRLIPDPVEPVLQEARLIARYEFHLRVVFDTNDQGRDVFDANRYGPTRHVEVDVDLVGTFTTTVEEGSEHVSSAIEGAGIHKDSFFR